jgi:hypothetical protein
MANLMHQSSLFRGAFEQVMGTGRSIPSTNERRWNSTLRQLKAIVDLDQTKLGNVLRESNQGNLVLSTKEVNQLEELVKILAPFAEATDLTQGDKMITISCVVPVILSLTKTLTSLYDQASIFNALVKNLLCGMHDRFRGVFRNLRIPPPTGFRLSASRDLSFDDDIFLMASAMDPTYAYHWLQDHPACYEETQVIRHQIDGKILNSVLVSGYTQIFNRAKCCPQHPYIYVPAEGSHHPGAEYSQDQSDPTDCWEVESGQLRLRANKI